MLTSETLSQGVDLGIITADQARRLRALGGFHDPLELSPSADDEQLRFVGGFSDIFVILGLALFLGATGYFGSHFGGNLGTWLTVAVTAWLLAEFFTRVRRMALPSIVLLIVFAWAAFAGAATILGADATPLIFPRIIEQGIIGQQPTVLAATAFSTVLVTALHYWRFHVPITIAAGCGALTLTIIGLFYKFIPELPSGAFSAVILACGLAIFALAMRFDLADPERKTLRTDIAFWLHLLAAPLIVHSVIGQMATNSSKLSPGTAITIIAVFLAFSFVAILIDRRAMLVSGLTYAGVAFSTLIRQVGLFDTTTPLTILTLGAFVLLLSAGWTSLRSTILHVAPKTLTRRLPPTKLTV